MSIIRYFKKVQNIDRLIKQKATGNQECFSKKVGLSRSALNIYLNEMKQMGFPICYCRLRNTYYYERDGEIVKCLFEPKKLTNNEMKHLNGGSNNNVWTNGLYLKSQWSRKPIFKSRKSFF